MLSLSFRAKIDKSKITFVFETLKVEEDKVSFVFSTFKKGLRQSPFLILSQSRQQGANIKYKKWLYLSL